MTPNGSSQDKEEATQVGARPADEVKQEWDSDPAGVSDGTEATPGPVGVDAAPSQAQLPDDQEELRRQIDETRTDLGDTVEALSAKADVKGQVKEKVDERKEQLHEQQEQAKAKFGEVQAKAKEDPKPFAAAAGGVVALLLLIRRLRRRGS